MPLEALTATFGDAIGRQLWERARGLDPRAVHAPAVPKSISRETTIEGGTIDLDFLGGLIEYLSERVGATLPRHGRQARTLALRLRHTDFYSAARAAKLAPPTNDEKRLLAAAMELFRALFTRRVALRFVGVSVTNLEPDRRQNEMFDATVNRRWYLNRGVDSVRDRYGFKTTDHHSSG